MSPLVRSIAALVAEEHGVDLAGVLNKDRKQRYAFARFDLMARLYVRRNVAGVRTFTTTKIGEELGLDHTSVVNGIQRWRDMQGDLSALETEAARQSLRAQVDRLSAALEDVKRRLDDLEAKAAPELPFRLEVAA